MKKSKLLHFFSALVINLRRCDVVANEEIEHPNNGSCEWSGGSCSWDYNLKPMAAMFDGGYNETFYAYVEPDVSLFYDESPGSRIAMTLIENGQYGKFINMSPESVQILWSPKSKNSKEMYIGDVEPFGSTGATVYPGHTFKVAKKENKVNILETFNIIAGESIYIYNPFQTYNKAAKILSPDQLSLWIMQYHNDIFAKQYKAFTGRNWLSLYKQKLPPRFHMWSADTFGEEHTITTKEIHFVELPPEKELKRGMSAYGPRPDDISRNRRHRDTYPTMDLTLKVLSCAPRVLEIENFLSDIEIDHIIDLAGGIDQIKAKSGSEVKLSSNPEDGTGAWVARHSTIITDAIYRRAADVLMIKESFLRYRLKNEIPEFRESRISIAEKLHLIHHDKEKDHAPQHDFFMPGLNLGQPSRFATIVLYLNDVEKGGQTSFPLSLNAEDDHSTVEIKPKKGKAILYYNLLPDGNYDERTMHSSHPVLKGEQLVAKLWIWDPYLDHSVAQHY